ncbi:aspartate kinase [Psychrosphaera sp. B3R10]|uniref:aspartate kinase n=1 Tax=unclassified Psychrosphaera TaxID=2641570 RepID=UPI001C094230|nr:MULTISPECIES: aspartate kinase [unclassified Psychrosphaera]MBU2881072.1 aspartate kinase [Psychrosphaera sp. I2R16]MBU2989996.1 aspartate kinase [Psychrosphaera sp. B3R10]
MSLLVHKYGGTSVATVERIKAVADRIIYTVQQGHQVVVVVSAMAGETNRLIELAAQVDNQPSTRELDMLITTGEQVSASLLAMALVSKGYSAISLLAEQIGIKTSSEFGKARIESVSPKIIQEHLSHGRIVIAAGFQGRNKENDVTTLGRGGTDTTAVAIAAALKADECLIYTDVDGVYTTDPRIESNARRIKHLLFDEMLELASLGAKVLQKRSVEMALNHSVKLRVLSSFTDYDTPYADSGTLVTYEENLLEQLAVTAISAIKDEALVWFHDLDPTHLTPADILGMVADEHIEVDMVVQSIARGTNGNKFDFAFTVSEADYDKTMSILGGLSQKSENKSNDNVQGRKSIAKISVVGVGMRSHVGVVSKILKTLADEHVHVDLISTSEIKVSILVEQKYMELAVRALHSAFALNKCY